MDFFGGGEITRICTTKTTYFRKLSKFSMKKRGNLFGERGGNHSAHSVNFYLKFESVQIIGASPPTALLFGPPLVILPSPPSHLKK
jgi:hypothetical protein